MLFVYWFIMDVIYRFGHADIHIYIYICLSDRFSIKY